MTPAHIARIIERLDPVDREALEQYLNFLDEGFKRQANAAKMGMDAAKRHGSAALAQAEKIYAECNLAALESERAANELLTNENQRLLQERDALAEALNHIKACAEDCTGAEPSLSVLMRAIDESPRPDMTDRDDQIRLTAINHFADIFAGANDAGFIEVDEEMAAGIEDMIRTHGHDNYHRTGIIKNMNKEAQ